MKKQTVDRREYLKRIAANRNWRRLRRAPRKRFSSSKPKPAATRTIKLVAPEVFSLATPEHRDAVMSFLRRLQENVKSGRRASINFDKTRLLVPCGTLLFIAVLSCLLTRYPGRVTSNYPTDPVVEQLFQHVGLLSLLGNTSRVDITADNVRYWYFLQGTTTDTSPLKELFAIYSAGEIKEKIRQGLYEGLSEAITNTIQHAYVDGGTSPGEENGKRWWMFSQQKDGKLSVVVCDLGIGIPTSLRQKFGDHLKYYASRKKRRDTNLIEVAVQSTRSRTRLPHRGKGLPDMFEFVKSSGLGGFLIYSLYGAFAYNAENAYETGRDFLTDIPGTLIQWTVPLNLVAPDHK